ncbi:flagellar type III secretion system protein FlhB [Dyella sp. M7H15-1]|uniref:flagellar type III secretion system protein FlhB n=1 Tax=Dyella sp. M7H15-1 TaxID=2501295 RepID=UPI001004D8AE|nr:flagellar type III secretion system protein FlhB [Dyella sp. M7H15-1]QAU24280.1 flagellar type III secretion system protein FlhB [Dyella sp. M7H15-1]
MQASTGDKTEKATPQKLRKAREEGQVARSKDIGTAAGLFVALKILIMLMPSWLADLRHLFALSLARFDGLDDGLDAVNNASSLMFPSVLFLVAKMVLPLLAVPLCVIAASMIPGGWMFVPKNFAPKFNRLNPLSNLKRLVSGKHYAQLGTTLVKVIAVGAVLWYLCRANLDGFARLQGVPMVDALHGGTTLLMDSVLVLSAILIAFSLIDVPLQKMLYMREQRMSKKDVKEEHKNNEGRPEVKSRIRQLQRQMAHRSIRKMVPDADVVVVNPTHYAVALKYDENKAQAPYVLAKGIDETALFIRQVAREHKVEVLEMPPLARAIYRSSQVNQQIPAVLYRAVAQVLTYVLQIKAFRKGQRSAQPLLPTDFDIPQNLSDPHQP